MVQEIITYCILFATFIIVVVKIIRFFNSPVNKCNNCTFSESGCKIAPLKKR